jgi:hypothetical protein
MPGSLLIADTVDVHSFTGLGRGHSTGGQGGGVSNGDWAAVATLRKCYALRLQRDVCNIFKFMNEVKCQCRMYIKHTINKRIYKSSKIFSTSAKQPINILSPRVL